MLMRPIVDTDTVSTGGYGKAVSYSTLSPYVVGY